MQVQGLFAVACVAEFEPSVEWYARLFGREPDERPMDWLVQWRFAGGAIQVWKDAERAGRSLATIVVPDIEAERRRLADAGLHLGEASRGDYGAVAQIDDPDGNRLTLAEPPKQQA